MILSLLSLRLISVDWRAPPAVTWPLECQLNDVGRTGQVTVVTAQVVQPVGGPLELVLLNLQSRPS